MLCADRCVQGLKIAVKIWLPKLLPPLLASPHEQNDARVQHCTYNGHDCPGNTIRGRRGEWDLQQVSIPQYEMGSWETHHVEAKSEGKDLSTKIEQSRDLRRLWLVALIAD